MGCAFAFLTSHTPIESYSCYAIIAATVVVLLFLIKIGLIRTVIFDVNKIHQAVKKGVGHPLPEALDIINKELERMYPGYIIGKGGRRWILFNGGGAMGQMTVLHASLTEYIIFYGSPLYSQGHSGRYIMDVYDFMIQGETKTYHAGELVCTTYKAGDYSLLKALNSKGYCCEKDGWMVEYARGFIPYGLPYFLCSSIFVTVDIIPWLTAVWRVGRNMVYNMIVKRKI